MAIDECKTTRMKADDFGDTALLLAAGMGDANIVRLLLAAGANVHRRGNTSSPIEEASSMEVARILVAAGADLNDVNAEVRALLAQRPRDGSISCSAQEYRATKYRVRSARATPNK